MTQQQQQQHQGFILHQKFPDNQKSDDWINDKLDFLSSSEAGRLLGRCIYLSPIIAILEKALCYQKIKTLFQYKATNHGNVNEKTALNIFREKHNNIQGYCCGFIPCSKVPWHPKKEKWLGASPDWITENDEIVEIKCPIKRSIYEPIPDEYLDQVQVLLYVTNLSLCHFVQYNTFENEMTVVQIEKDASWVKENIPILEKIWNIVQKIRKKYHYKFEQNLQELNTQRKEFANNDFSSVNKSSILLLDCDESSEAEDVNEEEKEEFKKRQEKALRKRVRSDIIDLLKYYNIYDKLLSNHKKTKFKKQQQQNTISSYYYSDEDDC